MKPIDWKAEYTASMERHNQTLDELNIAYAALRSIGNRVKGRLRYSEHPNDRLALEDINQQIDAALGVVREDEL